MGAQVLGIDFSGDAAQWKSGCRNSNVWIAFAEADGARLRVTDLKPVQDLPGDGAPFERLLALLATPGLVAAIDAPFSAPAERVSEIGDLWALAAGLPASKRPFGRGGDLVAQLVPDAGKNGVKQLRASETVWHKQRLNVRSTLWSGPRGGAAFAVACMTLLHRHAGPVWPLRRGGEGALLAEAYPAAQLLAKLGLAARRAITALRPRRASPG